MNIATSEISKKQRKFKKQTIDAASVIFASNFGGNAYSRVVALVKKYNPEVVFFPRKKIRIRLEKDPKRIIAWAVAQRVREAREKQGLTQEDLAKKSGIARPNIARLEKGFHTPTLATLQRIARTLSLDMNILVATPSVTEEERLEFTEMAETGIDKWARYLEERDTKD